MAIVIRAKNIYDKSFKLAKTFINKVEYTNVDVTSYSNKEIQTTDTKGYYGEGTNSFSIESNELTQTNTMYNGENANIFKSKAIIKDYISGKETIELLCSIGEYYDEHGILMISPYNDPLPNVFEIGNIILPLDYTANGEAPISIYENGDSKCFKITGLSFIFDGAVWQKIVAQELPQNSWQITLKII